MAAKVVMVAVPTVMGIASIRVYTVSEVSADGLVTREKLNIYSPLPLSAQAQFVPERPGVIQSGLTTARESILPVVQAVKGACVSVKARSVNIYYAGEDVYYYLKDPPPGFLPRFGTVTMAGLLGMFLARKASHFKRLAVPLGLMSAGTSVCYPAQTVAVLKVTGKKVYAVGQWSSAAVSSLLSSKSQEPDIKETAASQPQTAAVAEEASERSVDQSSAVPETEVESAESVPVSDESVVTVVTEEASSVELAEIYPEQTPTETNTDPVAHSVPVETKAIATSEEINASVESEEPSDTKQAAEDISTDASPAEPTPSLEPETLKASLVESAAPVEVAAVESVPVESAPVESVESAPVESVESAPVESVESAPVESAPVESVESAPVESAPVESVESAPVESAPVESVPVEAVESAPVESAPVESAPVESAPVESVLVESVESAPVESVPVEAVPVEAAAVESSPVESAPVESAPVASVPVESSPVESAPVEAAEVGSIPSSEEPPAPKASNEPTVPAVESAEPEPPVQPESTDPPQVAVAEETLTPPQQPAPENSQGGSGFKPDPAILDFGQSNPEDEDLYSTRS